MTTAIELFDKLRQQPKSWLPTGEVFAFVVTPNERETILSALHSVPSERATTSRPNLQLREELGKIPNAAPQESQDERGRSTVGSSPAPAVAAPHIHRCMSCGERWYCPHPPRDCSAQENVLPSLTLRGPNEPTVFHHACPGKK